MLAGCRAIRDFHDMGWAAGVVETCENTGDVPGTQLGAKRTLNGVFQEPLVALDDVAHVIKYSIDAAPGTPADDAVNYIGTVRPLPLTDGDATFVESSSVWTDEKGGVQTLCSPIYQGALNALAASVKR